MADLAVTTLEFGCGRVGIGRGVGWNYENCGYFATVKVVDLGVI